MCDASSAARASPVSPRQCGLALCRGVSVLVLVSARIARLATQAVVRARAPEHAPCKLDEVVVRCDRKCNLLLGLGRLRVRRRHVCLAADKTPSPPPPSSPRACGTGGWDATTCTCGGSVHLPALVSSAPSVAGSATAGLSQLQPRTEAALLPRTAPWLASPSVRAIKATALQHQLEVHSTVGSPYPCCDPLQVFPPSHLRSACGKICRGKRGYACDAYRCLPLRARCSRGVGCLVPSTCSMSALQYAKRRKLDLPHGVPVRMQYTLSCPPGMQSCPQLGAAGAVVLPRA